MSVRAYLFLVLPPLFARLRFTLRVPGNDPGDPITAFWVDFITFLNPSFPRARMDVLKDFPAIKSLAKAAPLLKACFPAAFNALFAFRFIKGTATRKTDLKSPANPCPLWILEPTK